VHRPLVIADDPVLLDDILRLAAAAGADVEVVPDPVGARPRWRLAPLVIVGPSAAAACARAGLPRRPGLVLASAGPPGDAVWQLAHDVGAEHVACLPEAEPWLVDRLGEAVSGPARSGRVVGVIGGRGGAGASVLAAALAITAVRAGTRSILIDADSLGGGLDLIVGREGSPGLRWPDLAGTAGRINPSGLVDALPRVGDLCVLSWDRGELLAVPPAAMDAAVEAGRRSSDLVVLDLPRRLDEGAVHGLQAADLVLLVVPAEVRACAAAARVAATITPHCERLELIVRGRSPGGLRAREVAEALGVRLAGVLRAEPGLAAALERGELPAGRGRGPLADLCRALLADIANVGRAA
jgi:secretion/DNA translocation related CpaE-like protein